MKPVALIESIALPELRLLAAVDPRAAAHKAKHLCSDDGDFLRGALPLIMPWLAQRIGGDKPPAWVWSVGDAHLRNIGTLAVGRMDRDGVVPVSVGITDVDDEGPAPWDWDLLRLLSSIAVTAKPTAKAFAELTQITLGSYADTIGRLAVGDVLAARIDRSGLPETVLQQIEERSGESQHKRFITGFIASGSSDRLRRDAEITDDARAAKALRAAWEAQTGLPPHRILDLAKRVPPGGISSLGLRRWWVLIREAKPVARTRLLEIKERRPSTLSRVVGVSPFGPSLGESMTGPSGMQGVCSTMGGDPFQHVLRTTSGEYLVRTRCHARSPLTAANLDGGDRRRLGHLLGQLLATFHWQGLCQVASDPLARCANAAAAAQACDAGQLTSDARALAEHLRDLAACYKNVVKPMLRRGKEHDTLQLGA